MRLGPLTVPAGVVELRPPRLFDGGAWSRIRIRERSHLENWEPSAPGSWEERNGVLAWPGQWSALRGLARRGQTLPFMIMVDGVLAGQITIGNVLRGSLRSAWVGYWVDSEVTGGGVATAATALVGRPRLPPRRAAPRRGHRAAARTPPSIRVLTKLGFREEGLFRRYLDVAGGWRDHICFAMTAEEAAEGLVDRLVAAGRAHHP